MKPTPHIVGDQFVQTFRHWKPLEWNANLLPTKAGEVLVLMLAIPSEYPPAATPSEYLDAIPASVLSSREQWREFLAVAHTAGVWRHPLIGQILEVRASYASGVTIAGLLGEPWIKIASKRGFAESAAALEDDILDEFPQRPALSK